MARKRGNQIKKSREPKSPILLPSPLTASQSKNRKVLTDLNPLSLTPPRLPHFSANERRPFPHASLCQKGKNRGESNLLKKIFPCFSSRFCKGKDRDRCGGGGVWRNFFANTIVPVLVLVTGNSPCLDAIDEGNDKYTY